MSLCCEPTGEMVAALREVFALGGRPVGPGIARAALTAALMVQHEQRDQTVPSGDPPDPRDSPAMRALREGREPRSAPTCFDREQAINRARAVLFGVALEAYSLPPAVVEALHDDLARQIVDAILALTVTVTEEMVERAAEAGWRHVSAHDGPLCEWRDLEAPLADVWRARARAALEAALNPRGASRADRQETE